MANDGEFFSILPPRFTRHEDLGIFSYDKKQKKFVLR
jgi:hypothetical protein